MYVLFIKLFFYLFSYQFKFFNFVFWFFVFVEVVVFVWEEGKFDGFIEVFQSCEEL